MEERGGHLEGVVEHEDDLVVVIVDGHLQVQAVELAQVPARRRIALQGSRSMTSSTTAGTSVTSCTCSRIAQERSKTQK